MTYAHEVRNLGKEVLHAYYDVLYLQEVKKVHLEKRNVYARVSRVYASRKSETSEDLERLAAENQLLQSQIELDEAATQETLALEHFNSLLGSMDTYRPQGTFYESHFTYPNQDDYFKNSQDYATLNHELNLTKQKLELERQLRKPELSGGVFYQSFRYTQPEDPYMSSVYGAAGLAIPVAGKLARQRMETLRSTVGLLQMQLDHQKQSYQQRYRDLQAQHQKQQTLKALYDEKILPNNDKIRDAANRRLQERKMDVSQWADLILQTLETHEQYLEMIKSAHELEIQLMVY